MTGAYLSDQLRLLLLHLCPLWLRISARGNVAGAVAVGVVYGMEKRMNGGVAMEWLFGLGFYEKLKEKEKEMKIGGGGDGELGAWVAGSVRRSLWWLVQWLLWLAEVETREG